jgi:hypothetical protein
VRLATSGILGVMLAGAAAAPSSGAPASQRGAMVYTLSAGGYPPGVGDERAYGAWVRGQIRTISNRLGTTKDGSAQVELLLSLANFRLARELEPAASRWLLGDESAEVRRQLAESAGKARAEAERALDILTGLAAKSPVPRIGGKPLATWRAVAEQLISLAAVLEGIGRGAVDAPCLARLEPMTRDSSAPVAAAAKLWWIAGMRQAGLGSKILEKVDPATSKPGQLPYDFFSRLLHCRLLADRGSYAVATGLAIQMESRGDGWFKKAQVGEAKRAVCGLQIELAERWAERLERGNAAEEGAHRRSVAEDLRARLSRVPDGQVYRLGLAVPVAVEPPAPPAVPTRAATRPVARTQGVSSRPVVSRPAGNRTTSSSIPSSRPAAVTTSQSSK